MLCVISIEARNARACCLVRNKIVIDLLQSEINYIDALCTCRKYLSETGPSLEKEFGMDQNGDSGIDSNTNSNTDSNTSSNADSNTDSSAGAIESPSEDTDDIYSAFTFLYLNHKRFCDGLQEKVKKWNETSTIGDLFLENGELFSGYIQYVKSCASLLTRINTVVSLRQPLRYSKVIRLGSIATTAALDAVLEHYVVLPTQRLPQYLFVLFDMLKYTTKVQNDYALLTRAVEDTRRVLEEVFVQIDQAPAKHISELLSVVAKIKGKEAQSLVVPNRWLVRKGPLAGVTLTYTSQSGKLHTSTVRRPYCFLFNDIILCCERLKRKKKHKKERKFHYSYDFVVQLELCDVHSVYVNKVLEICLEVSNPSCANGGVTSWTIATDDESERFEWESDLSSNISSASATFHRSRRRARTFAHDSSSGCVPTSPFSNPAAVSETTSPLTTSSPPAPSSQKKQSSTFSLNKSKKQKGKEGVAAGQKSLPGTPVSLRPSKPAAEPQFKAISLNQLSLMPSSSSSSSTPTIESSVGSPHKKGINLSSSPSKHKTPMITLTSMDSGKSSATLQVSPSPPPPPPPSPTEID